MTYESYLSTVHAAPEKGKILATTLDYPVVMDAFSCTPDFLKDNLQAEKALVDSYFQVLGLLKADPEKSYATMGADVKQAGERLSSLQQNSSNGRQSRQPEIF